MPQIKKVLVLLTVATATLGAPAIHPRQLAGEGSACNSLLSSTDNGIGYGTENAENNLASLLGGTPSNGGGTGNGNPPPPPPPGGKVKRQGDKIANGAANVLNALGQDELAGLVQTDGDNVDGQLTGDAATIGEQVGSDEVDVLERLGNMVPSKAPTALKGA